MIEWLFVCYVFALFILPLPLWFLTVILLDVSCGGVEIGSDFNNEEKILSLYPDNSPMVYQSLERLDSLLKENVNVEDILDSDLCLTLFTKIRTNYPATTVVGKKCRVIITKLQNILKQSPECPLLPEVTIIESPPPAPTNAQKRFRALFGVEDIRINVSAPVAGTEVGCVQRIHSDDPENLQIAILP